MPIPVDDVSKLQTYLRGVLAKAKHHANDVDHIILALAGAIISRKDPKTSLEVWGTQKLGNALSVSIKGERYAFSYNHGDGCIDMKAGSYQGPVIHKFTNATGLPEVARVFSKL